jgi:stearoyl-CoA desaturase (delta-9 desaturase)
MRPIALVLVLPLALAACKEEAARLRQSQRAEGQLIESARRWLPADATRWSDQHRAKLGEVFAASELLRKLVEMRGELDALWSRSNATREQLVGQLQQWCARAEASGVRALQDMSLRLRSYAN